MIDQITVFLENKEGRLASLTRAMGDAGINMHALTIADTSDYGLVRIIADKPQAAVAALTEAGYRASLTKVSAIAVPTSPVPWRACWRYSSRTTSISSMHTACPWVRTARLSTC